MEVVRRGHLKKKNKSDEPMKSNICELTSLSCFYYSIYLCQAH